MIFLISLFSLQKNKNYSIFLLFYRWDVFLVFVQNFQLFTLHQLHHSQVLSFYMLTHSLYLYLTLSGISTWFLICSIVSSLCIASVWTELCRRSRNIRHSFCGHSFSLSLCLVAFACDLFISLSPPATQLLTSSRFSYYIVLGTILTFHGLFLVYLDYFWLSSLSTSFVCVFFFLLPVDLYCFSGILFRVLFHLFLILTHYPSDSENVIVTFITFTKGG